MKRNEPLASAAEVIQPENAAANADVRLHQAELLLNVSRTMASFEKLDEMLKYLVEITTREIGADRGTIFLNDPDTGELYS
ncbi:MAG: hypothetical protein N2Z74_02465, partial [Syntrophales bacterium]|nr:hypothetical protein [Syntrophales bacterium]